MNIKMRKQSDGSAVLVRSVICALRGTYWQTVVYIHTYIYTQIAYSFL